MSDIKKDTKKDVQYIQGNSVKPQALTSSLFSDKYHSFLSNKIERLTSALYVITGFIGHDEPVRRRLREAALDLVGQVSSAQFTPDGIETFSAKIAEIALLLRTAEAAGLISRMNASLLSDEYGQVGTFLREHAKDIGNSVEKNTGSRLLETSREIPVPNFAVKDIKLSKGHTKNINKNGRDYRRKMIIALLDKKQKISIKDAIDAIEGCSEKTIQRELLALVEEGIAIKEGERRWSTYKRAPSQTAPASGTA